MSKDKDKMKNNKMNKGKMEQMIIDNRTLMITACLTFMYTNSYIIIIIIIMKKDKTNKGMMNKDKMKEDKIIKYKIDEQKIAFNIAPKCETISLQWYTEMTLLFFYLLKYRRLVQIK